MSLFIHPMITWSILTTVLNLEFMFTWLSILDWVSCMSSFFLSVQFYRSVPQNTEVRLSVTTLISSQSNWTLGELSWRGITEQYRLYRVGDGAGGPVIGSPCAGMFGKRDHTRLVSMDKNWGGLLELGEYFPWWKQVSLSKLIYLGLSTKESPTFKRKKICFLILSSCKSA